LKTWVWEATPLMANGTLYITTSLSQIAAQRFGNVERRNASQPRVRSSRSGLLDRWRKRTNRLRNRRCLPDLPRRQDGKTGLRVRSGRPN
jgi:hypothetical protein